MFLPLLELIFVPDDQCRFAFLPITTNAVSQGKDTFEKSVKASARQIFSLAKATCTATKGSAPITYSEGGYIEVPSTGSIRATLIAYGPTTSSFPAYQDIPGPNYIARSTWSNKASVSGPLGPTTATAGVSLGFGQGNNAVATVTNTPDSERGSNPRPGQGDDGKRSAQGQAGLKLVLPVAGTTYYRAVYQGTASMQIDDLQALVDVYVDGGGAAGRTGTATAEGTVTLQVIPVLQRIGGVWQ